MFKSSQRKHKQNQASRIFYLTSIIAITSVSLNHVDQCHCKPNDARDCNSVLKTLPALLKPSRLDTNEADLLQIEAPQVAAKPSASTSNTLISTDSASTQSGHPKRVGRSLGELDIAEARDFDSSPLFGSDFPLSVASSKNRQQLELTRRLELPTRRQFHDAINDDENAREWRKSLEEASVTNALEPDSSDRLDSNDDDEFEPDASNLDMTIDLHPAAQHHSYGSHYGSLNKHHGKYYQYAESHKKGQYKAGFKRGNKKFHISGHSSQHKSHASGHVKWHGKKGKGSHHWDLKHKDKKHKYYH